MKHILIFIVTALCSPLFADGLLPPAPTARTHTQDVADQVKLDSRAFVDSIARRVEANIKACWGDSQHTPQAFLDQFGTQAAASLALNRDLVAIVMSYEQLTGLTILDRSILALVGNFTVNNDGTVTVTP
jgi:hypothetical protein